MKSKTKSDFSEDVIREIAAAQLGQSVQLLSFLPLTEGWFNTVYALSFSRNHPPLILRIAPDPSMKLLTYEKDMMRSEVSVYAILSSYSEIPIPKLYSYDFSRKIINRDYMLIEKLEGNPYSEIRDKLSVNERLGVEHQLVKLYEIISNINGERYGYFNDGPGSGSKSWSTAFWGMCEALLIDGENLGIELPVTYDLLRISIRTALPAFDEIEAPALVHWDLWPGNIFVVSDINGLKISGVIDWERAFWGDPAMESPVAVGFYDHVLKDGQDINFGASFNANLRNCLYRLYLWLVMVFEDKIRFDNADHMDWVNLELKNELNRLKVLLENRP